MHQLHIVACLLLLLCLGLACLGTAQAQLFAQLGQGPFGKMKRQESNNNNNNARNAACDSLVELFRSLQVRTHNKYSQEDLLQMVSVKLYQLILQLGGGLLTGGLLPGDLLTGGLFTGGLLSGGSTLRSLLSADLRKINQISDPIFALVSQAMRGLLPERTNED